VLTGTAFWNALANAFSVVEATDSRIHEIHVGPGYYEMIQPSMHLEGMIWGAKVVLNKRLKNKIRIRYWRPGKPRSGGERQPDEKAYRKAVLLRDRDEQKAVG
jgi:hypothetical protein